MTVRSPEKPKHGTLYDLKESQKLLLDHLLLSVGTKLNFQGLVDVFYDGYHLNESYYYDGDDLLLSAIDELVFSGGTLRLRSVERYFSTLRSACLIASDLIGGHVWMNLYVSRAHSKGLGRHTDKHSVLAVQVYGTKKWESWDQDGSPLLAKTLEPGNFIYMPQGVQHLAVNSSPLSAHLAVGLPSKFNQDDIQILKPIIEEAICKICKDGFSFGGLGDFFPLILGLSRVDSLLCLDGSIVNPSDSADQVQSPSDSVVNKVAQDKVARALLNTIHHRSMKISTFLDAVEISEPQALLLHLWHRGLVGICKPDGSEINLKKSLREFYS